MFMKDFTRTTHTAVAADLLTQPVISGILAGTLVETTNGWRRVETLRMGDQVQSFDGGLVKVLAVDRRTLRPELAQGLLTVPGGVLDNCADLHLLPGQHLLIETMGCTGLPDAAYALIPALALQGRMGCTRRHALSQIEVVTPMFATEEILWANSGLLIHCPGIADGAGQLPDSDFFPRLDLPAARDLLAHRERMLGS